MTARGLRIALLALIAAAGLLSLVAGSGAQHGGGGVAHSIELEGAISPATEDWVDDALDDAAKDDAELVIIRLDTPGGLDSSMRRIVREIIEAPMPVVVYVSPDGARAASAGVFITEAADVAAMAPQTNIGSASPIDITGGDLDKVLGRKVENDAAAFARALADQHGRNPELAERMVREATNVTAEEARRGGLIDLVAPNEAALLERLDGFRVEGPKAQTLDTEGLRVEQRDTPFKYQALQLIVNPTIAFLLLTVGLVGIAIEIFSPGLIVPGSLGSVLLLIGLYGTAQLPVTAVGILLLVAAVVLFIAEAHLNTHGLVGGAGVIALIVGGLLLYDTGTDALDVSVPVIVTAGVLMGGFVLFLVRKSVQAHRGQVWTGHEELVGRTGEVRQPLDPAGQVFVEGALWRAEAADRGVGRIPPGYRVRVESVDGLTLRVRPVGQATESEERS